MSTNKGFLGWGTPEHPKDEKLLKYLWTHRHTSPFEQAGLTVEVQAPIMVFREWHRHRTQSYNEMSGRYTVLPDLFYLPSLQRVQKQSLVNKQGSSGEVDVGVKVEFLRRVQEDQKRVRETYEWALAQGIAKEVARVNTPISQYSRMRASANLLNWLRFVGLRVTPEAQYEIRQYAEAVGHCINDCFPRTWALFQEKPL